MKKIVQAFFILPLFLSAFSVASQELTGIWRGYFITEGGEQYKYEVQLDHSKKASLSGVTYSYLDSRFYGKATFTGNFAKGAAAALVQETRTVEVRMASNSVACIMKCRLVYSRSGREEFLEGVYTSAYEDAEPLNGIRKGGDCGGGKVFLRKVTTSDFYVEPFLRNKKIVTESTERNPPPAIVRKPSPKTTVTTKKPTASGATAKKPAQKQATTVKTPEKKPVAVSVPDKEKETVVNKPVVVPVIPPTPATIRERKNELVRVITISNPEVEISLYDNGEIDDDTVSIYLDNRLILANKRLSTKPITYTLKLDETNPEHTMVMVAENLGRLPPNTSLMIIQDGDKRHQVNITSTEQKNAMVRFRYEGKK